MVQVPIFAQTPNKHTALNYTGRLRIKSMVQQRTVCKFSEDNHYCSALHKDARELAIQYGNFTSFISTDDKNKIRCGEPGCLTSTATCGKKVLVSTDQIVQSADHDFASITLVVTVVMFMTCPLQLITFGLVVSPMYTLKLLQVNLLESCKIQ